MDTKFYHQEFQTMRSQLLFALLQVACTSVLALSSSAPASSEIEVVTSGYSNSTSVESYSTTTETDLHTTIITITSCDSVDVCSTTTTPAVESIITTTVHGVVTSYTTYCPLPETTETETKVKTKTHTSTVCEETVCEKSTTAPESTTSAPAPAPSSKHHKSTSTITEVSSTNVTTYITTYKSSLKPEPSTKAAPSASPSISLFVNEGSASAFSFLLFVVSLVSFLF